MEPKKLGEMHSRRVLMLRVHVGTAENDELKYEMSLANGYIPTILSKQTGKMWCLSWDEIIAMAVEAGIDTDG